MFLNFKTSYGTYRLTFNSPLNIIIGDSSTGKTYIREALKVIRKGDVDTDATERITEIEPWSVKFIPTGSIVILDSDELADSDALDLLVKANRMDICLVVMGRKYARRLPVSVDNTYKLITIQNVTKNIPFIEFDLYNQMKSNSTDKDILCGFDEAGLGGYIEEFLSLSRQRVPLLNIVNKLGGK